MFCVFFFHCCVLFSQVPPMIWMNSKSKRLMKSFSFDFCSSIPYERFSIVDADSAPDLRLTNGDQDDSSSSDSSRCSTPEPLQSPTNPLINRDTHDVRSSFSHSLIIHLYFHLLRILSYHLPSCWMWSINLCQVQPLVPRHKSIPGSNNCKVNLNSKSKHSAANESILERSAVHRLRFEN